MTQVRLDIDRVIHTFSTDLIFIVDVSTASQFIF